MEIKLSVIELTTELRNFLKPHVDAGSTEEDIGRAGAKAFDDLFPELEVTDDGQEPVD